MNSLVEEQQEAAGVDPTQRKLVLHFHVGQNKTENAVIAAWHSWRSCVDDRLLKDWE